MTSSASQDHDGLRVAYLVNRYPSVSHTFIRREIQALEAEGVAVVRFALRGWEEPTPDPRDAAEREGTAYVLQGGVLPLLRTALLALVGSPRSFLGTLRTALTLGRRADRPMSVHLIYWLEACWLARQMQRERVSHLHAHFGTNPATVAMLAARLAGCTWSFTVHGPEEFDKPGALKLRQKMEAAAFVIAISSFGRGQLFRWIDGSQWGKVQVVHCGLEPSYFHSAPMPDLPRRSVRLLCVGRLCEQKGQLLLIEAVRQLIQQGHDIRLVLAGDGEMRKEAEEAIRAAGVQDRITITGWLSSDAVRDEITRSTALVLPSFAEGLPVVLMEAMALGRPVISTYVAGIPELVRPGENGWLVPAGSVEDLADAIKELAETTPERLAAMSRAGQQRCRERHSVDVEARKLAKLFIRAVQGKVEFHISQAGPSASGAAMLRPMTLDRHSA